MREFLVGCFLRQHDKLGVSCWWDSYGMTNCVELLVGCFLRQHDKKEDNVVIPKYEESHSLLK